MDDHTQLNLGSKPVAGSPTPARERFLRDAKSRPGANRLGNAPGDPCACEAERSTERLPAGEVDAAVQYFSAGLKGEYVGQHRDRGALDVKGWYVQASYRVLPWVQLVAKREDFRRSSINAAVRNRATTGGVNVEFEGGKVRCWPTTSHARSARRVCGAGC